MGTLLFIVFLFSAGLAVLSACFGWTIVTMLILAITGLTVVICTIIDFSKGDIVGGILTIVISLAVPLLGAWGLSYVCWDFWCWASVLIPSSVIIVVVFTLNH